MITRVIRVICALLEWPSGRAAEFRSFPPEPSDEARYESAVGTTVARVAACPLAANNNSHSASQSGRWLECLLNQRPEWEARELKWLVSLVYDNSTF